MEIALYYILNIIRLIEDGVTIWTSPIFDWPLLAANNSSVTRTVNHNMNKYAKVIQLVQHGGDRYPEDVHSDPGNNYRNWSTDLSSTTTITVRLYRSNGGAGLGDTQIVAIFE